MIDSRRLVKHASTLADRVVPPPTGITFLIYHRVAGGSDSAVDLDFQVFDRQLAYLAQSHRVISIDAAVAELSNPADTGWSAENERPDQRDQPGVVLTFDDGTIDFTDVVVPALERHGLPATLYVATQFVTDRTDFPWGAPPTSWAALSDATASGLITIGSHTHSHWLLDRLAPDQLLTDLDRSIDLIGEHIGSAPKHFAYPKAVPGSAHAEIAIRQRFTSAALAGSRVNRPRRTDLHRLARTPVQRTDDFSMFTAKAKGGFRLEGALRELVLNVRTRGASQ